MSHARGKIGLRDPYFKLSGRIRRRDKKLVFENCDVQQKSSLKGGGCGLGYGIAGLKPNVVPFWEGVRLSGCSLRW